MKERPILFSTGMVRAILSGKKTMSRRVIKPQPTININSFQYKNHVYPCTEEQFKGGVLEYCPYGKIGDRLWVRETFVLEDPREYTSDIVIPEDRPVKMSYSKEDGTQYRIPHYRATEPEPHIIPDNLRDGSDDRTRWKPAIFMPRWASRLVLEITQLRVERLQKITDEDVLKEGITLQEDFKALWNSINVERGFGWNKNPWVWVIEFKKNYLIK